MKTKKLRVKAVFVNDSYMDCYTAVFNESKIMHGVKVFTALSLSENPCSPQGVSQHGNCMLGDHLGKRIRFSELPSIVRQHIKKRLKEEER